MELSSTYLLKTSSDWWQSTKFIWLMTIYSWHLISVYLRRIYLRQNLPPSPQIYLTRPIGNFGIPINMCVSHESCIMTSESLSKLRKTPPSVVEWEVHVTSLNHKRVRYTWHDEYGETLRLPHGEVTFSQVYFSKHHGFLWRSSKSFIVHEFPPRCHVRA